MGKEKEKVADQESEVRLEWLGSQTQTHKAQPGNGPCPDWPQVPSLEGGQGGGPGRGGGWGENKKITASVAGAQRTC